MSSQISLMFLVKQRTIFVFLSGFKSKEAFSSHLTNKLARLGFPIIQFRSV